MKWTPVEEALPRDGEKVLILLFPIGKQFPAIHISSVQQRTVAEANHERFTIRVWENQVNEQVTHWMPLPELPDTG